MGMNVVNPSPDLDFDDSTAYTATTPPETIADNLDRDVSFSTSSAPEPGFTFIIRSVSCGRVITLLDGRIVLTQPGDCGSIHWVCVEIDGWLGFRNLVSGKFLGHDQNGRLCCSAERHRGWERFSVRPRRKGDYVLLMTNWDHLWPVGIKEEKGEEYLAKINKGGSDGLILEFIDDKITLVY
jgi:hypothetical protein